MRNLKRALSLALAFVMVMSLMIVGTSAKSYTDADKIDNQVAVEILGEIGVMVGNDDGSFAPDRDVTRAEMAVILTRILYGNNMNVDQFKNMNTFTDVPDWAEGFVNLCASLDIIAGRGNGIFDPDATVTSAEAALMLSRALGYFKNNAEFGNDWALAAMKRATQAGIIGGDMVLQANAGLDRDDVAQMTFNTLTKAVPVQYNELLNVYYNVNQGVIYALEFNYLQTLGYTNFNLVYKSNQQAEYGRPATTWGIGSYKDAGNGTASGIEKADLTPAGGLIAENVRMLAKDEIITVNNTPTYVYTQDTAAKDVYADLGADVCSAYSMWNKDGYTWTAYVNGDDEKGAIPSKNDTNDYKYTDKGSVTEVYVDDYAQTVTVVEINYFLGQVSKVVDGVATVRPLSHEGKILDDKTFATSEFDKGDYVVFTVDYNSDNEFYICEMMAPELVTGEVTRVEKNATSADSYICLDGEKDEYYYTAYPTHLVYDVDSYDDGIIKTQHPVLSEKYNFFMTPAGFILGFQRADKATSQYMYVEDVAEKGFDWIGQVILPDATEPEVELEEALAKTDGYTMADKIQWADNHKYVTNIDKLIWDYSVNSDGVYSLTYVPELGKDYVDEKAPLYQSTMQHITINNGEAYVRGVDKTSDFIIDKDTIFVDTMNHKAYTGYNEVPDVKNAEIAYVVKDGVAEIVYILSGTIYDENSIYFMLSDDSRTTFERTKGDKYYTFNNAYVDGVKQSLNVSYDALTKLAAQTPWGVNRLVPGVLYQVVKSEEDGKYITEIRYAGPETNVVDTVANDAFWISAPTEDASANTGKFNVTDETVFVLVDYVYNNKGEVVDYDISKADLSDMYKGLDHERWQMYVDVVERDGQTAKLVYLTHCKPIAMVNVTVENLTNATVDVYGNHIDRHFDKNSNEMSFQVQAGTWVYVDVEADEGYTLQVSDQDGLYMVGWGGLKINAATTANGRQITVNGAENVEVTGDKNVDVEAPVEVTLKADNGYTITGVKSNLGSVKANADGTWTVNAPAGTADIVIDVTVEGNKQAFEINPNASWNIEVYDAEGNKLTAGDDQLTVGDIYTVTLTATEKGEKWDGRKVTAEGAQIGTGLTANGKDIVWSPEVKIESDAQFKIFQGLSADGKVYDQDSHVIESYTGVINQAWYIKIDGAYSTLTVEYEAAYAADGTITFTAVK